MVSSRIHRLQLRRGSQKLPIGSMVVPSLLYAKYGFAGFRGIMGYVRNLVVPMFGFLVFRTPVCFPAVFK